MHRSCSTHCPLLASFLLAVAVVGCQSEPGVRVKVGPDQGRALKLDCTGGVAAGADDCVYLATTNGIQRYRWGRQIVEPMLRKSGPAVTGVAVAADGTVLATTGRELRACAAGYLLMVQEFRHACAAVACDGDAAYVVVGAPGATYLVRYGLIDRKLRTVLTTPDPIDAICAAAGGCLVASRGKVYRVTDPEPAAGGNGAESYVILLFAINGPVESLAIDPGRKIVYFADATTTYAWVNGRVVPILPVGRCLAWRDDRLTILQPDDGQLLQIGAVSEHVAKLARRPQ